MSNKVKAVEVPPFCVDTVDYTTGAIHKQCIDDWVETSARLPPPETLVLTTDKFDVIRIVGWITGRLRAPCSDEYRWISRDYFLESKTRWMPLPKVPTCIVK